MIEFKKYLRQIITSKKYSVFLLFVIVTSIFWFMNKLSKEYNQIVDFNMEFTNLPERFIFQENPPQKIALRVKTSGLSLFKRAFYQNEVKISLKKIKNKKGYQYFLQSTNLKKQIRAQVSDRLSIVEVLEDTLFLKLGKKSFKKVPVIPNVSVDYHLGYKSFSGVKIIPDSIRVSGPEMQVQKIKEVYLKPLVKEDIIESVKEQASIIKTDIPKIRYSTNSVSLHIEVEKITEKTLSIPVQIINKPTEEVVVYPKKITLNCQVRLSQFNEINEDDFILVCDYNQRSGKYMSIRLMKKPETVSSIKLQTTKVEYLILK